MYDIVQVNGSKPSYNRKKISDKAALPHVSEQMSISDFSKAVDASSIQKNYIKGLQAASGNCAALENFSDFVEMMNKEGFKTLLVGERQFSDTQKGIKFFKNFLELTPDNRKKINLGQLIEEYCIYEKDAVTMKEFNDTLSAKINFMNEASNLTDVDKFTYNFFQRDFKIHPQKSIEILKSADEKVRNILGFYIGVFEPEKYEIKKNGVLALNNLDEQYFTPQNRQALDGIFNQKTTKAQNASVEYLNSIRDKKTHQITIAHYLENDISNSLNPKPFETGGVAQTKDELRAQLSNARNSNGYIIFTNDEIEKIAGSENKIAEQSKVYNLLKEKNITDDTKLLVKQLSKEGVNESQIKSALMVAEELKTNPKLGEWGKNLVKSDSYFLYSDIFNNKFIETSNLENNIDVVSMILKDLPQEQQQSKRWDLLNIIIKGKNDVSTVQKLLDYGVIDKKNVSDMIMILSEKDYAKSDIQNNLRLIDDLLKSNVLNKKSSDFSENVSKILQLNLKKDVKINEDAINVLARFQGTKVMPKGQKLIDFVLETSKNGFNPELSKEFVDEVFACANKFNPVSNFKLDYTIRDSLLKDSHWSELLYKKNFDFKKAAKFINIVAETNPNAVFDKVIPEFLFTSLEKFIDFAHKVGLYNKTAIKYGVQEINFLDVSADKFKMTEDELVKKLEFVDEFAKSHDFYFNKNKNFIFASFHSELMSRDIKDHKKLAEYFDLLQQTKLKHIVTPEMLNDVSKNVDIDGFLRDTKQLDKLADVFRRPNFNSSYVEGILKYDGDVDNLCSFLDNLPDKTVRQRLLYNSADKSLSFYSKKNNKTCLMCFDEKFNPVSSQSCEKKIDKAGRNIQIVKEKSKNIDTVSIQLEFIDENAGKDVFGRPVSTYRTTSEINKIKDKKGKIIRVERSEYSDVDGTLNFKSMDETGKITTHSTSRVEGNKKIVEKHLFNPLNGTRTEVFYSEDINGNIEHTYKIIDRDKKILLDETQKIIKTDANNYISIRNGKKFKISHTLEEVSVFDFQTKKSIKINLEKFIDSGLNIEEKGILKNLLKDLNGEDLIQLSKSVKTLSLSKTLDSYFLPSRKKLCVGPHAFVLRHELGHGLDNYSNNRVMRFIKKLKKGQGSIGSIKEIQEAYQSEKALFEKFFGTNHKEILDYFINTKTHYAGKWGGLAELIAETKAILGSPVSKKELSYRSHYLQEYFQKTISLIAKRF